MAVEKRANLVPLGREEGDTVGPMVVKSKDAVLQGFGNGGPSVTAHQVSSFLIACVSAVFLNVTKGTPRRKRFSPNAAKRRAIQKDDRTDGAIARQVIVREDVCRVKRVEIVAKRSESHLLLRGRRTIKTAVFDTRRLALATA